MSRTPFEAKYSASASVDTVMPPGCPSRQRFATSMHFAVFTCGRSATPSLRMRSRSRATFASMMPASSTSAGVSRLSIFRKQFLQGARLAQRRRRALRPLQADAIVPVGVDLDARGADEVESRAGDEQDPLGRQIQLVYRPLLRRRRRILCD